MPILWLKKRHDERQKIPDAMNKVSARLVQLDKDLKAIDVAQEMGELEVTGSFNLPQKFVRKEK
jgi:hypothetical protein